MLPQQRRRSSIGGNLSSSKPGGLVSAHNNALLGDAANFIAPNLHVSMLIHPDGIALYAKLQTDPYFRQSSIAPILLEQKHQQELAEKLSTMTSEKQKQKFLRQQEKEKEALLAREEAKRKDLRSQLASNTAVVDVARAQYQHPITAPVLRFPMSFDATMESICEDSVSHFAQLLRSNSLEGLTNDQKQHNNKEQRRRMSLNSNNNNDYDDEENDEEEDDDLEDLLPATNPEDLELYVYHVEDPDMFKKDFSIKGGSGGENDDNNDGYGHSAVTAKSRMAKNANIMQEILAEQQQQQGGAARASRVNHTAINIGNYEIAPPLAKEIPLRVQLNLFQLIAAARKRRRKFIVRSGLHPSAVEECSPLSIYAVVTVSPFWLERRALEIQEETARDDVSKNEQKYMTAIKEAHAVSYNRAVAKARGHRQIRAFNGQIENFFLKLALRNALVKQASMSVRDVVEKHMKNWPETARMREVVFEQELKKRRCLFADYVQRMKLKSKIKNEAVEDYYDEREEKTATAAMMLMKSGSREMMSSGVY